jgi:hypothetical protein
MQNHGFKFITKLPLSQVICYDADDGSKNTLNENITIYKFASVGNWSIAGTGKVTGNIL